MPKSKFRVDVCRIAYGNTDIEVEVDAKNSRQGERLAMRKAEDLAGNISFSEHTSEYKAQGALRILPDPLAPVRRKGSKVKRSYPW